MSDTVTGLDLDRLERLAVMPCGHAWTVFKGGPTSVFVAALVAAVPSLLAAARANARAVALCDEFSRSKYEELRDAAELLRAALGTEQEEHDTNG